MDPTKTKVSEPTDGIYSRIARTGEPEYAAIVRNRSGQDAGEIDFGCKMFVIQAMCQGDKRQIVLTAAALLASIEEYAGMTVEQARKESNGNPG